MAAPIIRRTLISCFSATNSSLLPKSHFSVSFYFSTESTKPPLDHHTITQFLIDDHRFSPAAAVEIASRTRLRSQLRADSIIQFLKHTGFSHAQLERTFKSSPKLLSAHLETNTKPKFEILRDLGFTPAEVVEIVASRSRLLYYSARRISASIATLKAVLGSTAAVVKFLKSLDFLSDMESSLVPNIELLKSCGVPIEQITSLMNQYPRFFLSKPEKMRKYVEKAEELGSDRGSGMFIHAVRVVSSMTSGTWGVKVEAFRELGFSDRDIASVFRKSPRVFTVSPEKMRRVAEVLVGSGRYDRMSIVGTPIVFTYCVEKRIRPRLKVLRALEEKRRR